MKDPRALKLKGYLILVVTLCLVACSSNQNPTTTPTPSLETKLECERKGYPCTQAEVPDEVHLENFKLLADLGQKRDQGESFESLTTWLNQQANMVETGASTTGLYFRLKGGRYVWFQQSLETASTLPTFSSNTNVNLETLDTSGEDTNGDDKINNRDKKKGLILSAFAWEFGEGDTGFEVAKILRETPGFENNVTHLINQNVTVDQYKNWDNYDVINVMAHGLTRCDKENKLSCTSTITTGEYLGLCPDSKAKNGDEEFRSYLKIVKEKYPNEAGVTYDCTEITTDDGKKHRLMWISLESDWFKTTYPNGLDNKIIWFSSCQFFKNVESIVNPESDSLISFLNKGRGSLFLGWSDTVSASDDKKAASLFFELLREDGIKTEKAFNLLPDDYKVSDYDGAVAKLVRFGKYESLQLQQIDSNKDLRLREVIFLKDQSGNNLDDSAILSARGQLDDGQADALDVSIQIDGVEDGTKDDFLVYLELDGKQIGQASNLDTATKIDDYSYKLDLTNLSTNIDLSASKQYALEAIVDLPEGGDSRYEALVTFAAGQCSVNINWVALEGSNFPNGGATYLGAARSDPKGEITLDLGDSTTEHQLVSFFVRAEETSLSASFTGGGAVGPKLGGTGTYSPNSFGGFSFATANPDDSTRRVIGKSDARNLGSLSISSYNDGVIKGSFLTEVFIEQFGRAEISGSFEAAYNEDIVFQDVTRITTICNGL